MKLLARPQICVFPARVSRCRPVNGSRARRRRFGVRRRDLNFIRILAFPTTSLPRPCRARRFFELHVPGACAPGYPATPLRGSGATTAGSLKPQEKRRMPAPQGRRRKAQGERSEPWDRGPPGLEPCRGDELGRYGNLEMRIKSRSRRRTPRRLRRAREPFSGRQRQTRAGKTQICSRPGAS